MLWQPPSAGTTELLVYEVELAEVVVEPAAGGAPAARSAGDDRAMRTMQPMMLSDEQPRVTKAPKAPTLAPDVGIAHSECMQYAVRGIPAHVDRALRERSAREGKSLNEVAIEALERGLGLEGHPVRRRDLREIAGSWVRDREVERALDDQRKIDPERCS